MIYDLRFKNKRAFTLIELMVAVTVTVIVAGGGLIVLNRSIANQKTNRAVTEVVAHLKLVQNYAKTRQAPVGFEESITNLRLTVVNNRLVAWPNSDVGRSYFSLGLESGISVSISPTTIYYWTSGRVGGEANGTVLESDESANVYLENQGEVTACATLEIDALGNVKSQSVSNSSCP